MKNNNKETICENCGMCCLETEMILTDEDIRRIIENTYNLLEQDFIRIVDGFKTLKNIRGNCFFYN